MRRVKEKGGHVEWKGKGEKEGVKEMNNMCKINCMRIDCNIVIYFNSAGNSFRNCLKCLISVIGWHCYSFCHA